jgi:ankyrin repeat protein
MAHRRSVSRWHRGERDALARARGAARRRGEQTRQSRRCGWPCEHGREDVVEALLDAGADVNKADEDGTAPLSVARTAGDRYCAS